MDDRDFHDVDDQLSPDSKDIRLSDIPWGAVSLAVWVVLLIIFTVQNAENTTIRFLWIDLTLPLAVLVILTALASAVLTGLAQWVYRRKKRKRREAEAE